MLDALQPLVADVILPGLATLAVAVLTWMANAIRSKMGVDQEKAGIEIEGLRRDALHKAIRTQVEALVIEADASGKLPEGDVIPAAAQLLLAPLPDRVVNTNPATVQHFAGLTGPVMVQLAMQYLPRIIDEVRQMRARRG